MLSVKIEQSVNNNNSAVIEKKPAELKNKSPKYRFYFTMTLLIQWSTSLFHCEKLSRN